MAKKSVKKTYSILEIETPTKEILTDELAVKMKQDFKEIVKSNLSKDEKRKKMLEYLDQFDLSKEKEDFLKKWIESQLKSKNEFLLVDLMKIYNEVSFYNSFEMSKRISNEIYDINYIKHDKLGFKGVFVANHSDDLIPDRYENDPYLSENGRYWDYAYRPNGQNPVHIITKSKENDKYLFVMQPRPPLKKIIISFPAGLIETKINSETLYKEFIKNDNDKNQLDSLLNEQNKNDIVILNAIKELKEETGFFPVSIEKMHNQMIPKSAGMTTESAYYCYAIVDPKNIGEGRLDRKFDKKTNQFVYSENIKYVWLTIDEYLKLLETSNGNYLLGELGDYMYLLGYKRSQLTKPEVKGEVKLEKPKTETKYAEYEVSSHQYKAGKAWIAKATINWGILQGEPKDVFMKPYDTVKEGYITRKFYKLPDGRYVGETVGSKSTARRIRLTVKDGIITEERV